MADPTVLAHVVGIGDAAGEDVHRCRRQPDALEIGQARDAGAVLADARVGQDDAAQAPLRGVIGIVFAAIGAADQDLAAAARIGGSAAGHAKDVVRGGGHDAHSDPSRAISCASCSYSSAVMSEIGGRTGPAPRPTMRVPAFARLTVYPASRRRILA